MSLRHRQSADMEMKNMPPHYESQPSDEEPSSFGEHTKGKQFATGALDQHMVEVDENKLQRNLQGRHMQMIAMYVPPPARSNAAHQC